MECARTKMVFGGISTENLKVIAQQLFLSEFDPMRVKDEIDTLELEPVESRRIVPSFTLTGSHTATLTVARGQSVGSTRGITETDGDSETAGSSSSTSSGRSSQSKDDELLSTGSHDESSNTVSRSRTSVHSIAMQQAITKNLSEIETRGTARGSGWSFGVTATPFYEYKKRRRVSSRTFETYDEFIVRAMQRLQAQPTGHFVLKTPTSSPVFVRAPFVRTPFLPPAVIRSAVELMYARPCYGKPADIAEEEARRQAELARPADRLLLTHRSDEQAPVSYKRKK
jgi:hypothetical protein